MKALFVVLTLALVGCSTAKISLHTSPPGADVYAKSVGDKEVKLIGKTPLNITNTDLEKEYGGSGAVYIEFRKDGYKTDGVYVTEISHVDLNINRDMVPKRDLEYQEWLNTHISDMFEVRRLVQLNHYDQALKILARLKEATPMVSTIHEMEGGVLLMSHKYRNALESYRLAVKYDPERVEAVKMVRYLENTYGFTKEVDIADTMKPLEVESRSPAGDKKK
ncbi:MAG: hypothetical protein KDD38_04010 [Bdellovibrionales bacterium]|nr:hypothetical protein [Bdellovibrionales bacterium]